MAASAGRFIRDDDGVMRSPLGLLMEQPASMEEWESVRVIPFRPVWPGFAINTLLYAAVLWMTLAAPLALRRRRRLKRGLCPKCAYPIGINPVCTECGRTLKARAS